MKRRTCSVIAAVVIAGLPLAADQKPKLDKEAKTAALTEEEKEMLRDREILDNLELLQNLETIRDLDLFSDDDALAEKSPTDTKKKEKKK